LTFSKSSFGFSSSLKAIILKSFLTRSAIMSF
jgi:hypothetical protein